MSKLMEQLGNRAAGASPTPDPGTRVLKPGEDLGAVLTQMSMASPHYDPLSRPVFSSLPLNTSLADRLKIAAEERRDFDEDQNTFIGQMRAWQVLQHLADKARSPMVLEPPSPDAKDLFDRLNTQVTEDQNSTVRMVEHLNNLFQSGRMSQDQYTQMMRIMDKFGRGTDARIKGMGSSVEREVNREIPVLEGKRRF